MGTVYRTKGRAIWMMKYYRHGRPIRESSRTTDKTKAKKLMQSKETDIDRGLPLTPTGGRLRFEEAARDLVTEYRVNRRRSIDALDRRVTKHLTPFFGGRRMAAITNADVNAYIAYRQEQGVIASRGKRKGARIG